MLIYKVTNKITNTCYIGQTRNELAVRKQEHINDCRHGVVTKFYAAIRYYGEDAFVWEVIEDNIESLSKLNEREQYWIKRFNSYLEGYNSTPGGEVNPMDIPEVYAKHNAVVRDNEWRKKHSAIMKAVVAKNGFTPEHRKKISDKMKGNNHFAGKKLSEEHIDALNRSHYKKVECTIIATSEVHTFNSVKDATIWWYSISNKNKPYNYTTFADNIKLSSKCGKPIDGVIWKYV